MALWVCAECTTKYAVGLSRCPRCHCTEFCEEGDEMPKVGKHAGPTVESDLPPTTPEPAEPKPPAKAPDPPDPEPEDETPETGGAVTSELDSPTTTASGTTTRTRRTGSRGSS